EKPAADEANPAAGAASQPSKDGDASSTYIRNDGQKAPTESTAKDPGAEAGAETTAEAEPEADEIVEARLQNQAGQHNMLAAHYFNKWDLDMAELEFDEAVSIFPEFKVAHRDLCLLSLAKLNLPRSLAEFMMVTGIGEPTPYSESDKFSLDEKTMRAHYRK